MLVCSAAAPATAGSFAPDDILAFGCNDLVVIGRVRNFDYTHVDIEGDILGHGWITGRIKLRKVLRGRAADRIVKVRYLSHAQMREDRDFVFVLRPDEDVYIIKAAKLIEAGRRPKLANRCG